MTRLVADNKKKYQGSERVYQSMTDEKAWLITLKELKWRYRRLTLSVRSFSKLLFFAPSEAEVTPEEGCTPEAFVMHIRDNLSDGKHNPFVGAGFLLRS